MSPQNPDEAPSPRRAAQQWECSPAARWKCPQGTLFSMPLSPPGLSTADVHLCQPGCLPGVTQLSLLARKILHFQAAHPSSSCSSEEAQCCPTLEATQLAWQGHTSPGAPHTPGSAPIVPSTRTANPAQRSISWQRQKIDG